MKQTVRCMYCGKVLMEIRKENFDPLTFNLNFDIIKKCEGCSDIRKETVLRKFTVMDIAKSTENNIKV